MLLNDIYYTTKLNEDYKDVLTLKLIQKDEYVFKFLNIIFVLKKKNIATRIFLPVS